MGLFDIFTFKKDAEALFSSDNIKKVLSVAKDAIISQVKDNIPGQEKKNNVDQIVIGVIESRTSGYSNSIIKWIVSLIIKNVPTLTQLVYDFLKEKVKNL